MSFCPLCVVFGIREMEEGSHMGVVQHQHALMGCAWCLISGFARGCYCTCQLYFTLNIFPVSKHKGHISNHFCPRTQKLQIFQRIQSTVKLM